MQYATIESGTVMADLNPPDLGLQFYLRPPYQID